MAAQASANTFEGIRAQLKAHSYAPVYLLHGEEGYFIDELVRAFEGVLPDEDREFNLYVLHAPETSASAVSELCHRVPMMAPRQVVILKEAQTMSANELNKLHSYAAAPVESTILVIACRGAQAKGKDLMAAMKKNGNVVFESKKITDYNVGSYIGSYVRAKGLTIEAKGQDMLRDYIGTDLGKLYNEIDKLAMLLPSGASVSPEVIERNIGISREYNTFELIEALAERNATKAFRILAYFRANPKAASLVMVAAQVFNFFADLLMAHYADDQSDDALMKLLNLRFRFAVNRYRTGMRSYSAVRVVEILSAIRAYDAMSKGAGSRQSDHQLFYDLVYHILTAIGRL